MAGGPAERAGLAPAQVPRLKLKWALGYPGDVTAFAAPTVLNGTLFVGSASGAVEAVVSAKGRWHPFLRVVQDLDDCAAVAG